MPKLHGAMMLNALMYSYELSKFEYKPTHPFKPMRAKMLMELLHRYDLLYHEDQLVVEPQPLNEDLLYQFHDRAYIELIKKAERGDFAVEMFYAGLGTDENPIFESMYEFALIAAGGTHQGAMMLLNNEARVVFNPIGGFHHAGKSHAEGFCYINDIAVTIMDLMKKGLKVACIDIDAHHGNGVQDAFYDTDRVLTISLHESGETLYPGTGYEVETGTGKGKGYNVNIPLREGTDDEVYLFAFESTVPHLIESFKPDIVLAVIGCDTHKNDPLAHLNLTSNSYKRVIKIINQLSPKILALGAGGYNISKTIALWVLAWSIFCDLEPKDLYAGVVGGLMYGPESGASNLDDPPFSLDPANKELCFNQARKAVQFIKENVFP